MSPGISPGKTKTVSFQRHQPARNGFTPSNGVRSREPVPSLPVFQRHQPAKNGLTPQGGPRTQPGVSTPGTGPSRLIALKRRQTGCRHNAPKKRVKKCRSHWINVLLVQVNSTRRSPESRLSPYLVAPPRLIRVRELPRGNPGYAFLATSGRELETVQTLFGHNNVFYPN
jgi:hypothetical protein